MRSGWRHFHGFTLIEVLLATLLLTSGMALAFAIVRSTLAISTRGEVMASHNERMRSVESLLRRRLVSAKPLQLPLDEAQRTSQVGIFSGGARQMHFVADIPGYLGRGGPYLHVLEVTGQGGEQELRLGLTMLHAGHMIEETPKYSSELLVDGLKDVRLRYRGIDMTSGKLGDWQQQWKGVTHMPLLVSIEVVPAQGPAWPPLVVAPPQKNTAGYQ